MGKRHRLVLKAARCFTVIIPFLHICLLYQHPVRVSIPVLHVYFDYGTTLLAMVILTVFWEALLPIRRACHDGVFRFMYDLMPTVFAYTVVFAQWHLVLIICLILGAVMFSAWFTIALRQEEKNKPTSQKERRLNRIMEKRIFVLAMCSVLIIPTAISGLVYKGQAPILTPKYPLVSFAAPSSREESVF